MRFIPSITLMLLLAASSGWAQPSEEEHWYNNPLGFDPLQLHARNGFLLPALAVGVCLIATESDTTLRDRLALFNESDISWGYRSPYTVVFQNTTGVQFYLRRWMSVGADLGLCVLRDDFNSTGGVAVRPPASSPSTPSTSDATSSRVRGSSGSIRSSRSEPIATTGSARTSTR